MIAHQGKATAGKLHTDLMAAAGVQPDAYQVIAVANKLQACFFHTLALLFYYKNLIFAAVFE